MKNSKRVWAFLLTLVLILTACPMSFAAVEDTGFSDVAADAWYAGSVDYCVENELMSGTGDTVFSPATAMSRSMLATVLYRSEGSPAVTGSAVFSDVAAGSWYSDAVSWTSQNEIVSGYGNGLFGTNDPVTREQIATILWRSEGSPAPVGTAGAFADQSSISAYAVSAVTWARENGIINGKNGNLFDPRGNATRAEVATILMNYTQSGPAPTPEPTPNGETSVLIAYFSNTGNTQTVAEHLDSILDADLYEIVPEVPYTSADLNYNDSSSRVSLEHADAATRPAISGSVENMEDYNVIFLGYPIWWGDAPSIISTFLESYDFSGKTIVPFCTSSSSGLGSSATNLHSLSSNSTIWLEGIRFGGNASQAAVESWVEGLNLTLTQ